MMLALLQMTMLRVLDLTVPPLAPIMREAPPTLEKKTLAPSKSPFLGRHVYAREVVFQEGPGFFPEAWLGSAWSSLAWLAQFWYFMKWAWAVDMGFNV